MERFNSENKYLALYGPDLAYSALVLVLTYACYFAAQYGDEFTRKRFSRDLAAYTKAYEDFCKLYA